jgi:threonine synthase
MPARCDDCGARAGGLAPTCDRCGGFVRYVESDRRALERAVSGDPTAALPSYEPRVTMGEGSTPLVPLDRVGLDATVYGKLESLNPTCSFKDRGSALLVSAAADPSTPAEAVVVASTGNTAPSVAAYAARAGVDCAVVVPADTPDSKLAQVAAHGGAVYTVPGSFSDCFRVVRQASRSDERLLDATAVYSANPFVASADRTVAFELVADLGESPDWVAVPVGAGPLLGGVYQGFRELAAAEVVTQPPRMLAVQASGCHPIVRAFEADEPVRPWREPVATDIGAIADPLVGYPADGEATLRAVRDSGGRAVALEDRVIHDWADRLSRREGIYAEPAAAAGVAALGADDGIVDPDGTVVALVTGHGLKESAGGDASTVRVGDAADLRRAVLG